jgi:hypothetical protein
MDVLMLEALPHAGLKVALGLLQVRPARMSFT